MEEDIKKLAEIVALLNEDMMNALYHGTTFFTTRETWKIEEAQAIAKKYLP